MVNQERLNEWITLHALKILRISIGIIYFWFGALKFFPNLSPADQLAKDTIAIITFGLIPSNISIILLAIWETSLGILLMVGFWNRVVFFFLVLHLICTFVPLFCFVELSFTHSPYAFSLVGQYIMKNIIIVCAAVVINVYTKSSVQTRRQDSEF
ncbi:MAG TPA: DoxX family protein [Cyclobacteriaceae bacterium]|nr:DoxX family protein [Cyclobacteriaceae bacterium]